MPAPICLLTRHASAAAARTRIKDLIPEGASVFIGPAGPSACPASRTTSTPAGALNYPLFLNAEAYPGRSTVLLLRQATGF
jgi:hypothetical protein